MKLLCVATFFLAMGGVLLAQATAGSATEFRLYIRGESDDRYCAFNDSDTWKSEIKLRDTLETGTLTYEGGSVRTIELQYSDDTGDWGANDTYRLDDKKHLISLARIINVRDGQQEELWTIKDGKATKRPPNRPAPALEFVPDLPVVTDLSGFKFWPLVSVNEREIRSKGRVCTGSTEVPAVISSSVYLLVDKQRRWCAFTNRPEWNSQVSLQKPLAKGTLGFVGGRIALVELFLSDERGRWTILDAYGLDSGEHLRTLQRTIFGQTTSTESWSINGGRANRAPGSASSPTSVADYPVVQTALSGFGFWPLIRDKLKEIFSVGRACE